MVNAGYRILLSISVAYLGINDDLRKPALHHSTREAAVERCWDSDRLGRTLKGPNPLRVFL